jgi:hypothetical protein
MEASVAYISLEALSIRISPSHEAASSSSSLMVTLICIIRELSCQKYRIDPIDRRRKIHFEEKVTKILKSDFNHGFDCGAVTLFFSTFNP